MHLQDIILKLHGYWLEHRCHLIQPYDLQVGAGTFYPLSFFNILNPKPWRAAYVAPIRRPADGRYAKNPYRFHYYYQYQVLIKPGLKPEAVAGELRGMQQLYLASLKRLGINLSEHDIRFVEDDWESPSLSAWGPGWEVWFDGMEISQFTYMQQLGGIVLADIPVEITYGLERLAMYLQNKNHVFEVSYAEGVTLGDLRYQFELEYCDYYFHHLNSETQRQLFNLYETEARQLLDKSLIRPAYDFFLKASHSFNMLDARDILSQAERQGYVQRLRRISESVAARYMETEARKLQDMA